MNIKRNIQFSLKTRSYKGKQCTDNLQIRMRVSFNSDRLDILSGYSISPELWDSNSQRVKKGYRNKNGESHIDINNYLNKMAMEMNEAFKEFEIEDQIPSKQELELTYRKRMEAKGAAKKVKATKFWVAMNEFKVSESVKNSWQRSTVQKFEALENHIKKYKESPRFEDFNDKGITKFLTVLKDDEGLTNTTILKQLGYLKWFLRWAAVQNYHKVMDFENYKPHLVTVPKKVIFLTVDEIKQLMAAEIPEEKQYLVRVRDVFIFLCFTGIRHSDAYDLRRSQVKEDSIEITTKKTADSLVIELNDVSKRILDKYKDTEFPDNKALPVISNQKMNEYLQELCKLAGLDEEIRETHYKGNERIDVVSHKYDLITTHAGRRSFICNAIAAGVPVNVIMKWTGHSDYKAMKPYIDVADKIKAKEMNKLNHLI